MHIFNKKEFAELNQRKCSEMHFLDFGGMSIILGEKNGELYSPFSAPFGGFSSLRKKPNLEFVEKACEKLYEWLKKNNKKCHITLPPPIYGEALISQSFFCLQNKGFSVEYTDLNYSVDLSKSLQPHPEFCRKLRTALKEPLIFQKCQNDVECKAAYEIINENRKERGYPPHLSFKEYQETGKLCEIDYFLLYLNKIPIAGAIVYLSAPGIAQLVAWGDSREYLKIRPMNLLAISLIKYYRERDFSYFDVGQSSKNGIPNFGLSHFKSEIGCEITLKHTLML
jgi:hypothetical protein